MTPAELRSLRRQLGLSQQGVCRLIEQLAGLAPGALDERTLRRWESGRSTADFGPACLLAALRLTAEQHRCHGVTLPKPGVIHAEVLGSL